jgi:hypothetical protein
MPAYVITYRRPSMHIPEVLINDTTIWVTPDDWDAQLATERFEAIHNGTTVLNILPTHQ